MRIAPEDEPLAATAEPRSDGRRVGVLVLHGFTGSPAGVRGWAQALHADGFSVSVPRLPGHGTTWRDLNTATWQDWSAEAERAFEKLAADNDVLAVAGLSMGGGLALQLAAERPRDVAGVVLVNPAVGSARRDVALLPVLKHVIPALPGISNDIRRSGVRERAYDRTPLRAAHSMFTGYARVRELLPQVTAPILLFRSRVDHVVDPSSAATILATVSSRDVEERMLEESFHVATLDHDAARIEAESAAFLRRVTGGRTDG